MPPPLLPATQKGVLVHKRIKGAFGFIKRPKGAFGSELSTKGASGCDRNTKIGKGACGLLQQKDGALVVVVCTK
ncbi:hypothetical protein Tco_0725834, partial [Tanacetum coccineum]